MKNLALRLAAILTLAMGTNALAADPVGVAFVFTVKPSGNRADFDLTVTINYPDGVTSDKVDKALHDPSTLPSLSQVVTKIEVGPTNAQGVYRMASRGTQTHLGHDFHRWTVSYCNDARSPGYWAANCVMAVDEGDTGDFFESGGAETRCHDDSNGSKPHAVCTHRTYGKTKDFSALLGAFFRGAARLAIGGAGEQITSLTALAIHLGGTPAFIAASMVPSLDIGTMQQRFYDDARAVTEKSGYPKGKTIKVSGSNRGESLSITGPY
ncbi:MAG TPA: hypothetical protein VL588_02035 [Bdellovibrionota bacterium]|jgi:hypothetical protein|nr:hypothetical protein [Bdellovibrionota bacterium]